MRKLFIFCIFVFFGCLEITGTLHAASKSVTIRSLASIKDTLELAISQAGQSDLRFGNIVSTSIPVEAGPLTVAIRVTSNTGQRYQVAELLNGPLLNANNDQMGVENLKFKSSSATSAGTVVSSPIAASASAQTIFISDNAGTSDTLSVEYTLTVPPSQAPGDYSTLLTYTVSAL